MAGGSDTIWPRIFPLLLLIILPAHSQLKYLGTTFNAEHTEFPPLDGAREIIVSPDGRHVYATAEITSSIGIFSRDPRTGILDSVGIVVNGVDGLNSLKGVRAIVSSPDGRNIYTSGQTDDQVTAFARDSITGKLTFLMALPIGGPSAVTGLPAAGIAMSPDGRHLYATQFEEGLLCLFARDTGTGLIRPGSCLSTDSIGGGPGLAGITSVTLSPDGKNVYTTSKGDSTVLAFRRDSVSGNLGLIGRSTKGANGLPALGGVRSAIVSPDGKNVYVVTESDHTIVTFSRNGSSGELTYQDQYLNDSLLHWGVDLAIHPTGKYLYAAAEISQAISAYRRDTATGEIGYMSHFQMTPVSQRGLYAVYGVTVSPDGKHVYSLGWEQGSINFYEVVDTVVAPIETRIGNRGVRRSSAKEELFTLSYASRILFRGYLPPVRTLLVNNLRGQTVYSQPVEGNRIRWSDQSIAGLPAGLYYLVLHGQKSAVAIPWVKLGG